MGTFVVGDLHLTRHSSEGVSVALASMLERHAGARFIFAGDFFDAVADDPRVAQADAIDAILTRHPVATNALRQALDRGSELVFISGNHDAEVGHDQLRETLLSSLASNADTRQRLTISPWFWRDGDLHVEHGHLYDPDNAPQHPLIAGEPSLGVHFSAQFIHPTQAHRYLQANDGMPLQLLLSAFRWYGLRAPYVIYRYFYAAFAALGRSGPFYRAAAEGPAGRQRHARFAADAGVPHDTLEAVLAARATPTLHSWSNTFARMYLDRVAATALFGTGLTAAWRGTHSAAAATNGLGLSAAGISALGLGAAGLGAMGLVLSWAHQRNRYQGSVVQQLAAAAARIVETTDANLVVFGHAHREALTDHYANTSTFAFPREGPGAPYLEITRTIGQTRALRHYIVAENSTD